jgi:hypothetical protein
MEWLLRFVIGGTVVLLFSIAGDIIRPKSLAGIFGAAPSVALATLMLTVRYHGVPYAATEACSMLIGAAALAVYAWVCGVALWRHGEPVAVLLLAAISIWMAVALAGWVFVLGAR